MEGLQSVWGMQPALYLFLGGMGAGAFIAAMYVYFTNKEAARRTAVVSVIASVACLVVGLLLLLSELINPLRGMLMWQSFSNITSCMMLGAWIVFTAVVVFLLTAICIGKKSVAIVARVFKNFETSAPKAARVLGVIGIVMGVCVAVYTGILLMSSPGVPFWNTLLLPLLFTVSALDTGIALVEIVAYVFRKKDAVSHETTRVLEVSVVALVVAELIVLAVFLGGFIGADVASSPEASMANQSASLLVSGDLGMYFWVLVIALGLVVPLVASALTLSGKTKKGSHAAVLAGASGALVGGCALRFLVLLAGTHTDPVMSAVIKILGN
ncbi:NrfD/PsrC family molybdoenzyme membrane anchor subunit [Slackia heliotrinireducens]|uniref:NrfD/PsrC family molybdoenzyme membrane anchor subunit n=1 Tax=Slackia heliotrinireducens TaxID=84110 RepID=UPI0033163CA1